MVRIGFVPLLTTLFIGLKLGGVIDWSWWLVLSPVLFITAVVFVMVFLCGLLHILSESIQ